MNGLKGNKKTLALEIYDKSWVGDYWGANGALNKGVEFYRMLIGEKQKRDALSSLSSTYFSAAGNASANFYQARFYAKPIWVLRATVCFLQASRLSDKLEKFIGITRINPEELSVRIAILLASSRYKRYRRAKECTETAFSQKIIKGDTKALVLSYFLNSRFTPKNESIRHCGELRAILLRSLRSTTRVRVLRELGLFQKRRGDVEGAREYFSKALKIAESEGSSDQILKIQAVMR